MKRATLFLLPFLIAGAVFHSRCGKRAAPPPETTSVVKEPYRLSLAAPVSTWDEGLPLGNGLIGGLVWGEGNVLNLSLDRGDLWDERLPEIYHDPDWNYDTIRRLVRDKNQKEITRLFDTPYNEIPHPTKLPCGRLVMTLPEQVILERFDLDLKNAIAKAVWKDGESEVFFSAVEPVALIRIAGDSPRCRFLRPSGLDRLGYPQAEMGSAGTAGPGDAGKKARTGTADVSWMVQDAAEGLRYAVVMESRPLKEGAVIAVTVTAGRDGDDPLASGRAIVSRALDREFTGLLNEHREWWRNFWSVSDASIPDPRLQHHYNFVKYLYGAGARSETPPIPLQGLWTRDDGGLPPWKGDYHHDLNTQMTYLACHTAGMTEAGIGFIRFNMELLPAYRAFARTFFHVKGAAVPGVSTLAGKPTGGWSQYSLAPVNGLWVGHSFYLHWKYTRDRQFLESRAYPWLSEIAEGIEDLLEEREGLLYLPLSSSPEIHNNSLRAWLQPNSNYDLSFLLWAYHALAEMAGELGKTAEQHHWLELASKLEPIHIDAEGVLMFAKGEPFNESHRHHSHTMAIHPLGLIHVEGSDTERSVINSTLDKMIRLGTRSWVGYSFSWFSCILARTGRSEEALKYLEDYERAFILRNGFHANGDQTRSGLSDFTYRPFTLEGNFLAMEAVHEMLLQSWGGTIRIFPAVSETWQNVSFRDLRAEGGFIVSAERRNGETLTVRIEAGADGICRIRDPFAGGRGRWNRKDVEQDGNTFLCSLKTGEVLAGKRLD